jgi:hypothetical protein
MFQNMMTNGTMMWGMGIWGVALLVLVILSIAALVKYLTSK